MRGPGLRVPQLLSDVVRWGGGISQTLPSSWQEWALLGGPGDSGLSVSEWELVIPDWIPLDWSLELECVLRGLSLTLQPPILRSESWDVGQTHLRPLRGPILQNPQPTRGLGGPKGLCTIVIGQGVLGRSRGFFFPQPRTHFSKWSRLPLLLSWASRAGAGLARPGFPDAWSSEPSFMLLWL